MMEIRNAKIEEVSLGYEVHGILTCYLFLDYGSSSQSFGGYALDIWHKEAGERFGTAYGMEFVRSILDVVGVEKWEDLKGKNIRVKSESRKIHAIGHIIKDKWFEPEKDLKQFLE